MEVYSISAIITEYFTLPLSSGNGDTAKNYYKIGFSQNSTIVSLGLKPCFLQLFVRQLKLTVIFTNILYLNATWH